MKKLRTLFAQTLGVPEKSLTKASSPETISEWDSVNNLILISEIEKEYGVVITIDDVYLLKNMGDVYAFIKKKGVEVTF